MSTIPSTLAAQAHACRYPQPVPAAPVLGLALLGPPEARVAGRLLRWRTRKELALLAYLAVAGHPVPRETLVALLWPDSDAEHGRATLRRTLAFLRRGLETAAPGLAALVVAERDTLALRPGAGLALDTARLAAATRGPEPADAAGRAALLAELRAATAGYRGDFLQGFTPQAAAEFDDWAATEREAWHGRQGRALGRLAHLEEAGGELATAAETAARWAAHDPLDEAAHRALVRLRLASGDRAGALAAYERCRRALERELGVAPGPELQALAARARAAAPVHRPPPASATPDPAALVAGPLVGRDAEFGALLERYHAAAAGRPQAVLLEGEPGIGKTRLAEEFLGWAAAAGARTLRGRAHAAGRLPYGPLVEALRPHLAGADPASLVPPPWLAALACLLPDLCPAPDPPAGPPDDGALAPARRQEALTRTLLALAAGPRGDAAPLVLLLDDLQWAEPATLDVVAAVGRRAAERELPLLLLLTARGEALAAEPVLEPWLADLSRALPLARLALPPLAEADTRAWATALGPAGTPAGQMSGLGGWLHAETGGQPLYVVELLKALVARGALAPVRAARGWHLAPATADPAALAGGPPAPVRALLLGRLAGLPPAARALLTAAAVLGERATFTPLCRVAAVDEETALVALDHLLARRLLGEAPSPAEGPRDAGYRCTHAWLRAVVLADAGEARRHVFRRRALAAAVPAIGRHDRDAAPGYVAAPEPGAYLAAAAGGA